MVPVYQNDARALFPVGGRRSDEMTVRKTSIFGEVYLFSDTIVGGFSRLKLLLERFKHRYDAPRLPPIRNIFS